MTSIVVFKLVQNLQTRGGFRGWAHPARAPPKISKNMIFFGVKSWFFTWNTPKISRAIFFKCAPLTWNPGSAPGMISLLVSSVLDRGFDLVQSNQRLQNWYLFVSRLAVLKGSYRLVGLMCPSEETMRTLELCNNPSVVCWSDTKRISSLLFSLTMVSICLHIGLHTFHVI